MACGALNALMPNMTASAAPMMFRFMFDSTRSGSAAVESTLGKCASVVKAHLPCMSQNLWAPQLLGVVESAMGMLSSIQPMEPMAGAAQPQGMLKAPLVKPLQNPMAGPSRAHKANVPCQTRQMCLGCWNEHSI